MKRRVLLLVGHGSAEDPAAGAPVRAHAARIRTWRCFDEVRSAFWKEAPPLRGALERITADEVFVVPMFLADGYFVREVVPRELGLDGGPTTRRRGRRIRYCPPVGAHPRMPELVLRRATGTARLAAADRGRAALVVIGHGTTRSATSGATVHRAVDRLRTRSDFGAVACGFLDEEPRIGAVVDAIEARDIVLVPFFLAEGWHTRETIPRDLGLAGRRTRRGGRTLWYAPPVGTLAEVARLAVELARGAGAGPSRIQSGLRMPPQVHADSTRALRARRGGRALRMRPETALLEAAAGEIRETDEPGRRMST